MTMVMTEDRIKPVYIESEMKKSYIDYSMSVIVARALPDVRDGFKPVHRRILFSFEYMILSNKKKTKRCYLSTSSDVRISSRR